MLRIRHSNRAEHLLDALLRSTELRPARGLNPEVVLVPSKGLGRWLTLRTAERLGIDCNTEYAYLAGWLWKLFSRLVPGVPVTSPFEPMPMAWRLFEAFARLPDDADHAPLRAYLARRGEGDRMELALQVASAFAQYLVYRPNWLARWERGERIGLGPAGLEAWQARLWKDVLVPIAPGVGVDPKDAGLAELARRLQAGQGVDGLPEVLRVFGVPLLPPTYVEILHRLARFVDVELYVLNPCRQYWGEIESEKALARARLRGGGEGDFRETGNALLASWGRQGRENLRLLVALEGEERIASEEDFEEPGGATVLRRLQASLLDLEALDAAAAAPAPEDRSIQVHACHSLTRQLEVLHDQLLARFDADRSLRPSDVLVLLPDLDAAAASIDAVFGAAPRVRAIAYQVSGRSRPDATPLPHGFLLLLSMAGSRMDAPGVMGFLQTPAVAARYGFDVDELQQVRDWLRETGVRWGFDAAHRERLGLPAESRHSWADGLARLVLGYAMPAHQAGVFGGVLPYDEVEGGSAQTLGKLLRALSDLQQSCGALRESRSPAEWSRFLQGLLGRMFAPMDDEEIDRQRLVEALRELAAGAAAAKVDVRVGLDVVLPRVKDLLGGRAPGAVPGGAVTFAGIGALRGVPARIVAVLGLDGGVFPRSPPPSEFDLMPYRPQLGDRARRDDDRGAFLDALLAARDGLILAHTGRSIRDNALMPPSVLVAELLDHLAGPAEEGRADRLARFVIEHPLQPFSRRYFDGGPLYSYAGEYVAAFTGQGGAAPRFIASRLPDPEASWRKVDLETLASFLAHPTQFLLEKRLGMKIDSAEEDLPPTEPFALDWRSEASLGGRLVEAALQGADEAAMRRVALAGPELPHGVMGTMLLEREVQGARRFAQAVRTLQGQGEESRAFELAIGPYTVHGAFSGLSKSGLFGYRYTKAGFRVRMRAWLQHLALAAHAPHGYAIETRWLSRDALLTAQTIEAPRDVLAALLELYWQGLSEPLAFLPRTALKLIEEDEKKARNTWYGHDEVLGEGIDAWYVLAHGARGGFPLKLPELARAIVGPMVDGLRLGGFPAPAEPAATPASGKVRP